MFYASFLTVLLLLAIAAPISLLFGFGGALAARAHNRVLRWIGKGYTAMVRGVPDIVFFLFVPVALDQGLEWMRHKVKCPDWDQPIRQGGRFSGLRTGQASPFLVAASLSRDLRLHAGGCRLLIGIWGLRGKCADGGDECVPRAQLETAEAYGMSPRQITRRILIPQMWTYALPGLSNLWMILIKATPLLFLLGVEDIVYYARDLGGATKSAVYAYPHPDWRLWYFLGLLVFYLAMTSVSERVLTRITAKLSKGQATAAGEAQRKAASPDGGAA